LTDAKQPTQPCGLALIGRPQAQPKEADHADKNQRPKIKRRQGQWNSKTGQQGN
jgi:hypothetical protein